MQKSSEKVLLIIRGVPGAGKSTIAFSLVQSGLFQDYYEADMYFETPDGYKYNKAKIKEAHEWCYKKVKQAMENGYNTIVSNTSTEQWQYQKYIDLAKELGYNIQIMLLQSEFLSVHPVSGHITERMKNEIYDDFVLNYNGASA